MSFSELQSCLSGYRQRLDGQVRRDYGVSKLEARRQTATQHKKVKVVNHKSLFDSPQGHQLVCTLPVSFIHCNFSFVFSLAVL